MRSSLLALSCVIVTGCFTPVADNGAVDADNDGVPAPRDCDDSDASSTTVLTDADCDGVLTEADCDDDDPSSGTLADDADCDGTPTAADCDDADSSSATVADDADCDGTPTATDCDDSDPNSTTLANDADCDGVPTSEDCDDTDGAGPSADVDCDGVLPEDDCDDSDPNSTTVHTDADCDGTVTSEDCDDTNASSTTVATDADCDGTITPSDCDDTDPNSTIRVVDADCDTVLYADDCNDSDPALLTKAGDPDCSGAQGIASVSVSNDEEGVDINFTLTVTFTDPVDSSTLSGVRVGVSGVLDGVPKTQWVDAMPGSVVLESDGTTVTWTPDRGRLQEFETAHWVELSGVENLNGQSMARDRRTFETAVVDEGYVYRLQNGQFDGSLDTLPMEDGGIRAYLSEPFTRNFTGSNWIFSDVGGWWTMSNLWLGEDRLLEGHDGTGPAFMAQEGEDVFTGRMWSLTAAVENSSAAAGTSPHAYWLETSWQGPDRTLGYHDKAPTGESLLGIKDKAGGVYADHIWILHNVGPR